MRARQARGQGDGNAATAGAQIGALQWGRTIDHGGGGVFDQQLRFRPRNEDGGGDAQGDTGKINRFEQILQRFAPGAPFDQCDECGLLRDVERRVGHKRRCVGWQKQDMFKQPLRFAPGIGNAGLHKLLRCPCQRVSSGCEMHHVQCTVLVAGMQARTQHMKICIRELTEN